MCISGVKSPKDISGALPCKKKLRKSLQFHEKYVSFLTMKANNKEARETSAAALLKAAAERVSAPFPERGKIKTAVGELKGMIYDYGSYLFAHTRQGNFRKDKYGGTWVPVS
jgi:hypothetical protein